MLGARDLEKYKLIDRSLNDRRRSLMLIAVDGGNKNCKQKTGIAMAIVLQKQVNGGHQVLSNIIVWLTIAWCDHAIDTRALAWKCLVVNLERRNV